MLLLLLLPLLLKLLLLLLFGPDANRMKQNNKTAAGNVYAELSLFSVVVPELFRVNWLWPGLRLVFVFVWAEALFPSRPILPAWLDLARP